MEITDSIQQRLDALGILPSDIEERFVRGSGAGGQKINKTSSTVVLRYSPSGIEVRCQRERSQAANRETAWMELCGKLETMQRNEAALRRDAIERERRRKRGKSRAQKARMLADKRHHSDRKAQRGRVRAE